MAILFDTSVIVSLLIEKDKNHERAKSLIQSIKKGNLGNWYFTDFILDEILTVIWSRHKNKSIVQIAFQRMTEIESPFHLLYTSKITLKDIWEKWNKFAEYPKRPLSFTDASLLAIAEEYSLQYIASFDGEFEGLISLLN